jgi:hypothetical protein
VGGRESAETVRKRPTSLEGAEPQGVATQPRKAETPLLPTISKEHPAQGKAMDTRRRWADHCRGSPDRSQAKQSARPLSASHSAAMLPPVAGLIRDPGRLSSIAQRSHAASKTYLLPRRPEARAMKRLRGFRKIALDSLGVLTVVHQFALVGVECRSNFDLHLIL